MSRKYLIIPVSEVSKVNFSQICETSEATLRKSVDETKTFIKWDGDDPSFISSLSNTEGTYNQSEILTILSGVEWTSTENEV
tara:strand:- start:407 stop:652 length:246 start_codon:yes stop_codon:yes gene_type:complete